MPDIKGIDTSTAANYVSDKNKTGSELDKESFLKLLVTQMKYQDPMQPTSNTEYMSQLAQYSSLEATMNINKTLENSSGLSLAGKYVIMNATDSQGEVSKISGLVEFATVVKGEVLLSINNKYYPAKDLDSVVDYDYYLYLQGLEHKGNYGEETNQESGSQEATNE